MKDKIVQTIVTVDNADGFSQTFSTTGEVKTEIFDWGDVRKIDVQSTDSWVLTDANGCISFSKVLKPFTSDFLYNNPKVSDVTNHDIWKIILENIADEKIEPLFIEFVDRYNAEQRKLYEYRSEHYKCYTETDLWNAMQFAVHDVTGRSMRDAFVDVLLEDFLESKNKKEDE